VKSAFFVFVALIVQPLLAERFCFENTSAKSTSIISFNSDYNRISDGAYKLTPLAGGDTKTTRFHGTKSGTIYAITFKGKPPYKKPKGDDTIIWTRKGNNLEVPMYGKNAKTGKYADYLAKFVPCKKH
jgi:hypothetical protein